MPRTFEEYTLEVTLEGSFYRARLKEMALSGTGETEQEAISSLKAKFKEEFV